MNNGSFNSSRITYYHPVITKLNPCNQKGKLKQSNNVSFRRKNNLPISQREFGKNLVNQKNLTNINIDDSFNNKKTLEQKIHNLKKEKDILTMKLKNYDIMAYNKKKIKSLHYSFSQSRQINSKMDIEEETTPSKNSKITKKITEETKIHLIKINKNPENVDEYFDDIVNEIKSNEEKYLPDSNYMLNIQTDINHKMRAILIDWLIDVHLKYKLLPQTMYITVNLIDRYLSKNETNRKQLQLVGVAAIFIATKYEEIYPPALKDFVYITDKAYVKKDVLEMEEKMLNSLKFDITFPTHWSFLEIYKKKLELDNKIFYLSWFLMELCLIDYKILKFKMSEISASALFIAMNQFGKYDKDDFEKVTGYEENNIRECINEINEYYIYNSGNNNLQAVRRKFSSDKYYMVAKTKITAW